MERFEVYFQRKLSFAQIIGDAVETYAAAAHEKARCKHLQQMQKQGIDAKEVEELSALPEMAQWAPREQLEECYKESYRSQLRYIGEQLQDLRSEIGIRPVLSDAPDTINELYGPVLEHLASMEHERWMRDKRQDGWHLGTFDRVMKTTPELVPYDELEESIREFIRLSVRNMPNDLEEIGYELYRKVF